MGMTVVPTHVGCWLRRADSTRVKSSTYRARWMTSAARGGPTFNLEKSRHRLVLSHQATPLPSERGMQSQEALGPTANMDSKERIERLVAEGRLAWDAVEAAERLWTESLQAGGRMPNGETVTVTLGDLYHIVVDPRVLRHPERIAAAIGAVFEIRAAEQGRRLAFARWTESATTQLAVIVIDSDNTLRTLHLIDERRLERYTRGEAPLLWRQ